MDRIPVVVLGATGAVGQRFVQLLDNHPWFHVIGLTGSGRTVGQRYGEACRWVLPGEIPTWAAKMMVIPTLPVVSEAIIAFSALPSAIALEAEPEYAQGGCIVCSNASAFRDAPDVPILLPEVNPEHIQIVEQQRIQRGWKGFIVTNSNCTSTGMTVALKALLDAYGLQRVFVVSMQAISGAGYPGVPSMDILNNIIPYIADEEEKVEAEPRKMLGHFENNAIIPAGFIISAQTNRVPVSDGHTVCMSVELEHPPADWREAKMVLRSYAAPTLSVNLPSATFPVIIVHDEDERPQPRLDLMAGRGMATVVGRVRPDPLFDLRMVVFSHNTIRGAAGGSIYNAELLHAQGYTG